MTQNTRPQCYAIPSARERYVATTLAREDMIRHLEQETARLSFEEHEAARKRRMVQVALTRLRTGQHPDVVRAELMAHQVDVG